MHISTSALLCSIPVRPSITPAALPDGESRFHPLPPKSYRSTTEVQQKYWYFLPSPHQINLPHLQIRNLSQHRVILQRRATIRICSPPPPRPTLVRNTSPPTKKILPRITFFSGLASLLATPALPLRLLSCPVSTNVPSSIEVFEVENSTSFVS